MFGVLLLAFFTDSFIPLGFLLGDTFLRMFSVSIFYLKNFWPILGNTLNFFSGVVGHTLTFDVFGVIQMFFAFAYTYRSMIITTIYDMSVFSFLFVVLYEQYLAGNIHLPTLPKITLPVSVQNLSKNLHLDQVGGKIQDIAGNVSHQLHLDKVGDILQNAIGGITGGVGITEQGVSQEKGKDVTTQDQGTKGEHLKDITTDLKGETNKGFAQQSTQQGTAGRSRAF